MTVREKLRSPAVAGTTHAGLWLDRYLPSFAKSGDAPKDGARVHIKKLLDQAHVPDIYRSHYQRWKTHLAELRAQDAARTAEATVDGRMIVGLGAESVLEVGISLHRTYGIPVIPGSALKGLAAHQARRLADPAWRQPKPATSESPDRTNPSEGQSYGALFGDQGEAGCVVFHDALWIPHDGVRLPLELDVMTVHHAKYYGADSTDDTPPADSDDPNPIAFVTAQGRYLIALEGPPKWTDAAMTLLKMALSSEGIGAKTAAGYGRLTLDHTPAAWAAEAREKQAAAAAAEQARKMAEDALGRRKEIDRLIGGLKVGDTAGNLQKIFSLCGDEERSAIARRCEDKLGRKPIRDAYKADSKWVRELAAILYPGDKGAPS